MPAPYRGIAMGGPQPAAPDMVRALQTDLRSLGYLKGPLDGIMGNGTRQAIRALQYDLLRNQGLSTAQDGAAPVKIANYNKNAVTAVTGITDAAFADIIETMLADENYPKIPQSDDPAAENRNVIAAIAAHPSSTVPTPFLLALFQQESSLQHFCVPQAGRNPDNFVVMGLDRNAQGNNDVITSRGYGIGQYTLFHHPPTQAELSSFVLNPIGNLRTAVTTFRVKFDTEVAKSADDRIAEHPLQNLRLCRYTVSDPRYLADCQACARAASKVDITPATALYKGSTQSYGQAKYYAHPHYTGVPNRADFQCDWPYAARRYNGGGPDSYNYQAIILGNLLTLPKPTGG